jgi:hypothetical protein
MAWVPIPDLGQGLNLDGTPEEIALGVSTDGRNIRYRAGYAQRFHGMRSVYTTPLVTPYHVTQYTVGTTRNVVYAGLQKTYADDGTTQTDITNANNTGATDDRYTGGIFNGVYIQNNGVDVPQFWGGNTALNLANLTAWPAGYKAGFMRPFKNYLVAGDITRGGVRERGTVLWSHIADPGTIPTSWDIADPTKDAGDISLSETNGTLIDCLPMGDMNVLYKDDAIHFQQAIQSSQIFRFGRLPGDSGLIARGCVAAYPGGHVYLTPGLDVVTHSGQGLQSILEGRMRTWLAANINTAQAQRSFLVAYQETHELLICFPSGSAVVCDKALIWNWKDNTFALRDLPNVTYGSAGQVTIAGAADTWSAASGTWDTETSSWGDGGGGVTAQPRVIFTTSAPALALFDDSKQDMGANFTGTFEFSGWSMDSPESVKLARGLRPLVDAASGATVYFQLGASMTADVYPTWGAPQPFVVGTDIEIFSFARGRFLAMRGYASVPFRMRSAKMDVVALGAY